MPVPVPMSRMRCSFSPSIGARNSLSPMPLVMRACVRSRRSSSGCAYNQHLVRCRSVRVDRPHHSADSILWLRSVCLCIMEAGAGWTRTARPKGVVTTAMFDGIIDHTRRQRCRECRTLKHQRSLASSLVLDVEWLGAARVVQLSIVKNRVSVVLLSQCVSDECDRRHPGPDCSILGSTHHVCFSFDMGVFACSFRRSVRPGAQGLCHAFRCQIVCCNSQKQELKCDETRGPWLGWCPLEIWRVGVVCRVVR